MEAEALAVAILVAYRRLRLGVALDRADPPLGRANHGDRLALHQRLHGHFCRPGRLADGGAARAKLRLLPEARLDLRDLGCEGGLLPARAVRELLQPAALRLQRLVLAPDRLLFQPSQRTQAHVEDRVGLHVVDPERGHERGLGLVLLAHDSDHLVEVEVGDEVAAEHVEPVSDRRQAMGSAPQQNLAPVIEKRLEHLLQRHHAGQTRRIQHVHVEPDAGLQLGLAEQHLHQELGFDRAALGLQHDAHVLGRFVAHVGEQGELAGLEQLGDALNQTRLLHLIGDFGDPRSGIGRGRCSPSPTVHGNESRPAPSHRPR